MSRQFLDFVAKMEGTEGHPRARGYNTTLDYGRWTGGPVDLTAMTLDEVDALQTKMLSHPENRARYKGPNGLSGSSALGRYQVVRKTLRGLREELGLRGDERFTPELQDKIGAALMARRGRDPNALRNEWAGLKRADDNAILAAWGGGSGASGGYSRAEIEAEMKRRGLLGAEKPAPTYSRDAIEAEMKRRGLLNDESSPVDGLVDRVLTSEQPEATDAAGGVMPADPLAPQAETEKQPEAGKPLTMADIFLRGLTAANPAFAGAIAMLDDDAKAMLNEKFAGGTFEFGDEIAAALNAGSPIEVIRGIITGKGSEGARERYDENVTGLREERDEFRKEHPVASTVANIAGGAAALGPVGGGLVGAAKGTLGKVGAGALEGAAVGSAYGAGAADDKSRLEGAASGGIGGAVAGGVLARAGVSLNCFLTARAASKSAKTTEELRNAANSMFNEAAKSGIVYKPQAVRSLSDEIARMADDELITRGLHDKAWPLYERVLKELESGQPVTLGRLVRLRQLAAKQAYNAKSPEDGKLAKALVEKLDDFSLDDAAMATAGRGARTRKEANKLWSQYRKAQTIEEIFEKAALDTAATGSGGNINNNIRRGFRTLLTNKKKMAGFSEQEREAIRAVVKQGATANTLRLLGKISPEGNGLSMMLNLGAAGATGGTSMIGTAAGMGAKRAADSITTKRAARALQTVLNGGSLPRSKIEQLTAPERRAVARALMAHYGEPIGATLEESLAPATR